MVSVPFGMLLADSHVARASSILLASSGVSTAATTPVIASNPQAARSAETPLGSVHRSNSAPLPDRRSTADGVARRASSRWGLGTREVRSTTMASATLLAASVSPLSSSGDTTSRDRRTSTRVPASIPGRISHQGETLDSYAWRLHKKGRLTQRTRPNQREAGSLFFAIRG